MTAAVVILGLIVIALLILRDRERTAHEAMLQSFADRVQHPEVRQVEAKDPIIYDPPKDEAEMAYVGQFVPDGISVGLTDGE